VSPPLRTGAAAEERAGLRWRLEDQRDFLVRSLADLRAEHQAGDLESRDYRALLARDEGRLAAVEDELRVLARDENSAAARPAAGGPGGRTEPAGATATKRHPAWLAVVATVALTAGATLLVVHLASPRLPGQPETGGASLSLAKQIQTQLAQASILVEEGTSTSLDQALALYREVLAEDPAQPQALAETGYLEWEAGFVGADPKLEAAGRASVERSLKVEPKDYAAHLFLGTIELKGDKDPTAAVAQFELFLSEHPPEAQIASAAPLIETAFGDLGQPVPAGVG
jgi:hypothetical protein